MSNIIATLPEIAELRTIFNNFYEYSSRFFKVIDRETDLPVPFNPRPVQKVLIDSILQDTSSGRPALVLVLKSRRLGITSAVATYFMYRCMTRPYQMGLVLAHRLDSAYEIYDTYRLIHKFMPDRYNGICIKPNLSGTKGKNINFTDIDSRLLFGTADARELGRGGGGSMIHISEAAFAADLEGLMAQIMPRIPAIGDKVVILESTSAGPNNHFYELWKNPGRWRKLFFSWWQDPLYRLPDYTVPEDDWDDEERELVERFGLDGSQLAWRRYKIDVDFSGDIQRFRREYPSTDDEAFCAIGNLAWSSNLLNAIADLKPPIWRGNITPSGKRADPEGNFLIWEEPIMDSSIDYVVGVDTAAGISEGHDSAIEVFRVGTKSIHYPVQVAEWVGKLDPITLAQIVCLIGTYYKRALVAVEINNTGIATQNALQKMYYYPRLYRWIPLDSYKARGEKLGWQSTYQSRKVLIGLMDWLVRNRKIVIRSKYLMDELNNFQEVAPGDYAGLIGDDRIDATMIACVSWFLHIFRGLSMKDVVQAVSKFYGLSNKARIEPVEREKEERNETQRSWWGKVFNQKYAADEWA
ncbi:MAG: hypothetical protein QXT26_05545 [Thermoproteota archaeon]